MPQTKNTESNSKYAKLLCNCFEFKNKKGEVMPNPEAYIAKMFGESRDVCSDETKIKLEFPEAKYWSLPEASSL